MIHEALRLTRVFYDMSQSELAERLGISKSHLSEIESGKKNPTLQLLQKYSEVFDIPVSSMMFFAERLENPTAGDATRAFVSKKVLAIMRLIAQRSGRS